MIPIPAFPESSARAVVRAALDEDLGPGGDVTTRTLVPRGRSARAVLVAREDLVAAGLPLAALVMDEAAARGSGPLEAAPFAAAPLAAAPLVAAPLVAAPLVADGTPVTAGTELVRLEGDAWTLLAGERVLLNLVGRLSGIATLTARCVAEIAGTGARIADTRKTTPGLRALEKYAVALGGGENHRPALDALLLAKDNHKLLAGGIAGVLAGIRAAGLDPASVEVEVDSLAEFDAVLAAGVGWILLDNFTVADVAEAARRAAGRARLEASGGLRPGVLRAYAEAGVQRLSLGLLTHGARAVDVALDVLP